MSITLLCLCNNSVCALATPSFFTIYIMLTVKSIRLPCLSACNIRKKREERGNDAKHHSGIKIHKIHRRNLKMSS